MRPEVEPVGSLHLLVVHPSAAVRRAVLAACPVDVVASAVAHPGALHPLADHEDGHALTVVVALDPARTSPTLIGAALGRRAHVLSICDLQLDSADPAVDSTLPLRRLTCRSLAEHLRGVATQHATGSVDQLEGSA